MSTSSFSLTKISSNSLFTSLLSLHNHNWDDECRRIGNSKLQVRKNRNLVMRFYTNLEIERSSICWTQHHFVRHSINGGDSTAHDLSNSESYPAEPEGSVESTDSHQEKSLSTTKFYYAPAPGKMGYLAAVSRFLKVMAMVWAGSQVTKPMRAAGALALAPLVDRGLSWFTVKYKFQSRGKAFFTIVVFCLSLAVIMFLVVTLLWA